MLSNIAMKNPLFAAWKNSLRREIGQFEHLRTRRDTAGACVRNACRPKHHSHRLSHHFFQPHTS